MALLNGALLPLNGSSSIFPRVTYSCARSSEARIYPVKLSQCGGLRNTKATEDNIEEDGITDLSEMLNSVG